jgi:hypothetical protein
VLVSEAVSILQKDLTAAGLGGAALDPEPAFSASAVASFCCAKKPRQSNGSSSSYQKKKRKIPQSCEAKYIVL